MCFSSQLEHRRYSFRFDRVRWVFLELARQRQWSKENTFGLDTGSTDRLSGLQKQKGERMCAPL